MSFWQVADASPESWPKQRCLTEPSSAAIAELIQEITGINLEKAQRVVDRVCHQSSILQAETDVTRFRSVTPMELKSAGLSTTQTVKLIAAIELGKRAYTAKVKQGSLTTPEEAAELLMYDLGYSPVEKAAILVLNNKHNLIAKDIFSVGACDECIVDPKVVFTKVLQHQGNRFIIAHCHPSGCLDPSKEDLEVTKLLIEASKFMNLPVLDHLILGEGRFLSIRTQNSDLWIGCEN